MNSVTVVVRTQTACIKRVQTTLQPGQLPDEIVVLADGTAKAEIHGREEFYPCLEALETEYGIQESNGSIPAIHLNGSSAGRLLDDNNCAQNAIMRAIDAMNSVSPHGRDFYTKGDGALAIAIEEHDGRVRALQGVLKELVAIEDGIRAQVRR